MESEGIAVSGLIEISAVDTVPEGDVSADLSGDKLGESAHACEGFGVFQSEE